MVIFFIEVVVEINQRKVILNGPKDLNLMLEVQNLTLIEEG